MLCTHRILPLKRWSRSYSEAMQTIQYSPYLVLVYALLRELSVKLSMPVPCSYVRTFMVLQTQEKGSAINPKFRS